MDSLWTELISILINEQLFSLCVMEYWKAVMWGLLGILLSTGIHTWQVLVTWQILAYCACVCVCMNNMLSLSECKSAHYIVLDHFLDVKSQSIVKYKYTNHAYQHSSKSWQPLLWGQCVSCASFHYKCCNVAMMTRVSSLCKNPDAAFAVTLPS